MEKNRVNKYMPTKLQVKDEKNSHIEEVDMNKKSNVNLMIAFYYQTNTPIGFWCKQ